MFDWFIPTLIFTIGAMIGSLLNVVVLRYPHYRGFFMGRSECPQCHKSLVAWELIPILSFFALRGRCSKCKVPISWQYPLVELLYAVVFSAVFWPLPSDPVSFFIACCTAIILAILLALAVIDWRTFLLPDTFLIALIIVILVRQAAIGWTGLGNHLIGAGIGGGFLLALWAATRGKGLGFGDVKLLFPVGFLLGQGGVVTALFIAFVTGGFVGVILLASKKAKLKTAIPFGPFLLAASALVLLFPELPTWGMSFLLGEV